MDIHILESNRSGDWEIESIHSLRCLAMSAAMTIAHEVSGNNKLVWSGDKISKVYRAYIQHDGEITTVRTSIWDISDLLLSLLAEDMIGDNN